MCKRCRGVMGCGRQHEIGEQCKGFFWNDMEELIVEQRSKSLVVRYFRHNDMPSTLRQSVHSSWTSLAHSPFTSSFVTYVIGYLSRQFHMRQIL